MAVPSAFVDFVEQVRILIQDVGQPGDFFITGNYTIPTKDETFRLDVRGSATVTLPACSIDHPPIIVRKIDTPGVVTIERAGSDTIDGASSDIVLARRFSIEVFTPSSATNWATHEEPNMVGQHQNADLVFSDQMIYEEILVESVSIHQMWLQRQLRHEDAPTVAISNFFPYEAFIGGWCSDTVLYDEDNAVVTPDSSDLFKGIWYFDSDNNPDKELYVRGTAADLYSAAADLLTRWATTLKLGYNTSNDKGSFSRLDRIPRMLELAEDYRSKSWPYNVRPVSPYPGSNWSPNDIWKRGW
jgi:hypothetical protein